MEEKIRVFRHSLAHSKEQANNYVSFIDIDPNYLKTQTKIIISANAAIFYISGIFENLSDLYDASRILFNQKISQIKLWHPDEEIKNAKQEAIDILTKTNDNLRKNGYTESHTMKYN